LSAADAIRFADILTTASAVANYLGSPVVIAEHMLAAIAILEGSSTLEDLGRPVSPLIQRGSVHGDVDPDVRDLVQRWFASLEGDANARLDAASLDTFRSELRALAAADRD
jgi:hypothetical protein